MLPLAVHTSHFSHHHSRCNSALKIYKKRLEHTSRQMLLIDHSLLRIAHALRGERVKKQIQSANNRNQPIRVECLIATENLIQAQIQNRAQQIVTCLKQFGIAVVDNFVGDHLSNKILKEAKSLNENGAMENGQTTNVGKTKQHYRTDQIAWVNGTESACRSIGTLMNCTDNLIKCVKTQLTEYDIQERTQAMVACYPGHGANYVRHVDNPNKDGRCLTCIYYINKNWKCEEDGGMLKIYPEYNAGRVASIEPVIDRLLVFWSDKRNPHEVLPAFRTRYAVIMWYFDHNERSQATTKTIPVSSKELQRL